MNRICISVAALVALCSLPSMCAAGTIDVLHGFSSSPSDSASQPITAVEVVGSTVYGTTSGYATLFDVGTNGTGYTQLEAFDNKYAGEIYYGENLTVAGSELFGTLDHSASSVPGEIFMLNRNGSGFTVVHSFAPSAGDAAGGSPLVLSGNTLYGSSGNGGANNDGAIYALNANGTGYSVIYSFSKTAVYGPVYGLVVSGSEIYGVAADGGANGLGGIFDVSTNGTGFSMLHSFSNASTDANDPVTGLTLVGSTLYGASFQGTVGGGAGNGGAVYEINTDGTGFGLIHTFSGQYSGPYFGADLVSNGSVLYGSTFAGGTDSQGSIFEMNLDGSGYNVLSSFNPTTDGGGVNGLTLSGSMLYGTTEFYGPSGGGTVFSFPLPVPEPSSWLLAIIGGIGVVVAYRLRRRAELGCVPTI